VNLFAEIVEALAIDVSGADLSGLKPCEFSLLANVVWIERTVWPVMFTPGPARSSPACSR
jgi:hypothetical protein